jgi:hypothetical protein
MVVFFSIGLQNYSILVNCAIQLDKESNEALGVGWGQIKMLFKIFTVFQAFMILILEFFFEKSLQEEKKHFTFAPL